MNIALLKAENHPLVYIDESGFEVDVCRTHGYSARGERCNDKKNWRAKGRLNAIGALLAGVLLTVTLITGTINSNVFYQWTVDELIPKLPDRAVVIMDNASFHKRADIIEAIANAGFIVEFLPPYSPDYNPIEKKWSQYKSIRRQYLCEPYELFSEYCK